MNKQPWHFYILQDKASIKVASRAILHSSKMDILKSGLKEAVHAILHPGSIHLKNGLDFFAQPDPVFHGAPLVILLTADKGNEWSTLDIGMCAQNMLLAAASLGVQSCPVGIATFITHAAIYDRLNIPANQEMVLGLIFGYSDETPEFHPRKKDNAQWLTLT
jgi:nitroreductase